MYHGKLNTRQPILANSGSRTSVLNIAGVMSEVLNEVTSLRRITYLVYSFREIGCA